MKKGKDVLNKSKIIVKNLFNKKNIADFLKTNRIEVIIFLIVTLLVSLTFYLSYAYFTGSASSSVIKGLVGSISNADIKINVFTENRNASGVGDGTYTKTTDIPQAGYDINSSTSGCSNSSTYSYNSSTKTITINAPGKDTCNFYFSATGQLDVNINIYAQNRDQNGVAIADSYSLVDDVPEAGYELNTTSSSCTNGSTYTFDNTTNAFTITASGRDTCNFYFMSTSTADIQVQIYSKPNNCTTSCYYEKVATIPNGKTFNSTRSTCTNGTISYTDSKIVVVAPGKTICGAYFD
jgi:hypothetical protein